LATKEPGGSFLQLDVKTIFWVKWFGFALRKTNFDRIGKNKLW
jgi:hypothetical protein